MSTMSDKNTVPKPYDGALEVETLREVRDSLLQLNRKELGVGLFGYYWNTKEKCFVGEVCALGAVGVKELNIEDVITSLYRFYSLKRTETGYDGTYEPYEKVYGELDRHNNEPALSAEGSDVTKTFRAKCYNVGESYEPYAEKCASQTHKAIYTTNDRFVGSRTERYTFMLKWLDVQIEANKCQQQGVEG